jgi:tetratricopeptide (TPR) repeat protein
MGMIFKNRKLYKLAIYYFEKSLYPRASVPALISLSQVYDELGNQTASKAYLDIADKLYEDNEGVLDELSRYYELRGNLGKALSLAKKSVALDPEDWIRLYRLYKLYAKQEEKNLAREALLQTIAFAPPEELSKLKRELRK